MSRLESPLGRFSGKLGDHIFTFGKGGKNYIRQAVKPGSKKHEPGLRSQYIRTARLNKLAAELNSIFKYYYRVFNSGDSYQRMLSIFRSLPYDHPVLLMNALCGFDLNARYPLDRMGIPKWSLHAGREKFEIQLAAQTHAILQEKDQDEYFYEVRLIQWNETDADPTVMYQQSEWVHPFETLPEFDFTFKRLPDTTRWMFLLRIMMGKHKIQANSSIHEGVRIIEMGSYKRSEKLLLDEARRPKVIDQPALQKVPEMPRVKRKN